MMLSPDARSMVERLVGFPTVSRDSNLGLIEWVRDYLASLGARSRLTYDASGKKANLFATLGDSGEAGLVLSGHTDVVPVDGQDWQTDPFKLTERDGKLYARGTADMKGFIGVALAQAPKFLQALNGGVFDVPLHFALSYDEEVGCLGVRRLIQDLRENSIKPSGCVVGEPTSMQPIIAHKGMNLFRCAVRGREAHSSLTSLGVNAIEYASRLIVQIRQVADRLAQLEQRDYGFTVPFTTLSTGLIRGGIAANVVPKDCEFQFDMRTLPSASADTLYQEIRGYADALTREMKSVEPETGIALEWACQVVGLEATEADSIVQWAMRLARSSSTGKVSYGTEAGLFRELGIPTVVLGPGDIAEAHRPNEFVSLDQLAQCQAFLDRVVGGAFLS